VPLQWKRIEQEGGWPFQRLCDRLTLDMLDPTWEVRHGACLALREVLAAQAAAAAVQAPVSKLPSGWLIPGTAGAQLALALALRSSGAAVLQCKVAVLWVSVCMGGTG
jgi:TATA-binding protein-associated factor